MAHYAKVLDGIVTQVIVAEPEFFDNFVDNTPGTWIETSKQTHGGVHSDGGTPLRKNYASIGGHYDSTADAFYEQTPYDSWVLNTTTYLWEAPTPMPDDGNRYEWNEADQVWEQMSE